MSYCRWSTDNFNCDIYAYESDAGYEIHVANNRRRLWYRIFLWLTDKRIPIKLANKIIYYRSQRFDLYFLPNRIKYKLIKLACAGESYTCNLEEFREKMIELRNLGYKFPNYVLGEINYELQEKSNVN